LNTSFPRLAILIMKNYPKKTNLIISSALLMCLPALDSF
jgi:hypothetical protein